MRKLDILDLEIDRALAKPGPIDWQGLKTKFLQFGVELDRKVLISRVKAGLKRRKL